MTASIAPSQTLGVLTPLLWHAALAGRTGHPILAGRKIKNWCTKKDNPLLLMGYQDLSTVDTSMPIKGLLS
jgi:hypothetical protein